MSSFEVDQTGSPASPVTAPSVRPVVAAAGVGEDTDLLALFKAEMAADLAEADVRFPHKYRAGYEMSFGTDLNGRTLLQWQKKCVIQTSRNKEVDAIKLAALICANLNTGIYRNRVQIMDQTGEPLTFRSPEFWYAFDADEPVTAVQQFFSRDGFLQATAEAVLKSCGYDDEVSPDPTGG